MDTNLTAVAANIELAIFDVDGVFTDGKLYLDSSGEEAFKVFHVRDGYGIKDLLRRGIQVAIISGRSSAIVAERMKALGVKHITMGCDDKLPVLTALAEQLGVKLSDIAYLGDDELDIPAIKAVGLGLAVADAHPKVSAVATGKTQANGGQGAVREVCDFLLWASEQQS